MQATSSTVFVTGATGFIGQHLVRVLQEKGFRVRAMIRPEKDTDERIPQGCEQVSVGLNDVHTLTDVVAGSSAVIYCAGSVRGRNPGDFSRANVKGVRSMLEALERADKTIPLLLLSSLAASRPHLSDYAHSKHEGEEYLHRRPSLNWTILRPPAVYGPGDREMLPILQMIRKGLLVHAGPPDQRLSLLHVDDLADAMVAWLSDPQKHAQQTYSIDDGTPGGYSWTDIGEAVSDGAFRMMKLPRILLDATANTNLLLSSVFGYAPMLTPGKVRELVQPEWLCDNSAFTTASGWQPQIDLKQGSRQLFAPE